MFTGILAAAFAWCLFYGALPNGALLLTCALLGVLIGLFGSHGHAHILSADIMAQSSPLKNMEPSFKLLALITLMIISIASKNPLTGLFLAAATAAVAFFAGKVSARGCLQILSLPVTFLLVGGFALLFEVIREPVGYLNVPIFGLWLSVTAHAQERTLLVVSRALGAVSCLCLLSVTTPMSDITGALRKARCPDVLIDLMYLIYRYIFITLNMQRQMENAAKSRLGCRGAKTSLRTAGTVYANVLARSYGVASKNFDAMESRCYGTGVSFLERQYSLKAGQICIFAALIIASLAISLH